LRFKSVSWPGVSRDLLFKDRSSASDRDATRWVMAPALSNHVPDLVDIVG